MSSKIITSPNFSWFIWNPCRRIWKSSAHCISNQK